MSLWFQQKRLTRSRNTFRMGSIAWAVFMSSLIAISALAVGCGSENIGQGSTSDLLPGCSPEPIAQAPDVVLCGEYDQVTLEAKVKEAGGGCGCKLDCTAEIVPDATNGTYAVACSNGCGTFTAFGRITCSLLWIRDWEDASVRAREENKPVMINFYTDVCPACRQMDKYTFTDAELAAFLNEHFVNLKSNAGKSGLSRNYGIPGVPTTVFTDPNGIQLTQLIVGAVPADMLLDFAQQVNEYWINSTSD